MPRRRKEPDDPALKPVAAKILDEFVHDGVLTVQDIDAAMRRFKKALIERALGAELTHHLGYPPGPEARRRDQSSQRQHRENGTDRRWHRRHRRPARSPGDVRAGAHSQARAPLHRL